MPSSRAATPLPNSNAAAASQTGGQADGLDLADSLGAFLLERGIIDSAVPDRSRRAARTTGEPLVRVLTKLGLLSEADLTASLCGCLSIAPVSLGDVPAEQRLRSRRGEPGLLDLREEATRILPAHTWLSELRLNETPEGRQVVMTGFSAAAASLVSLIERSPLFGEASLAGPVSVDQAEGKERFVIQTKVAGAARRVPPRTHHRGATRCLCSRADRGNGERPRESPRWPWQAFWLWEASTPGS